MKRHRLLAIVLLGALAVAVKVPSALAQNVMKLGTSTLNDAQHEWMKKFAAIVEKNSNGRIKVEIYPASQLGTSPRMIECPAPQYSAHRMSYVPGSIAVNHSEVTRPGTASCFKRNDGT